MFDQYGPNPLQDAFLCPALKPAMHSGVVAKLLGQFVPLTTGSHLKDDAVEAPSPARRRPPGTLAQAEKSNRIGSTIAHSVSSTSQIVSNVCTAM